MKFLQHSGLRDFHINSQGALQLNFTNYIVSSTISDYEMYKDKLLTRLGDTITNAERQWYNLAIKSGEDSDSLATRIALTGNKDAEQLYDCGRNVVVFVLFKIIFCYAGRECYEATRPEPTDVTEAATLASELALPCVSKSSAHQHHRHHRCSCRHSAISSVVTDSVSPNVEVKHQVAPTNADIRLILV